MRLTLLRLCRSEYLSHFHPAPSPSVASFVSALTERMASRVLLFFVRHASLVRPLSAEGKLRLAKVSPALSVHHHNVHTLFAGAFGLAKIRKTFSVQHHKVHTLFAGAFGLAKIRKTFSVHHHKVHTLFAGAPLV